MRLHRLFLRNVRNHEASELLAADRVNLITGMNGRGKTSILEAISLCTLTRSFVAANDSALLRRGEEELVARVDGISDYGAPRRIEVRYGADGRKQIALDGSTVSSAAKVIGSAPTVVLFPDLKAITGGPPLHRRRFLDLVLSQAKRRYLEDLMQYRRLLKQRNTYLSTVRRHGRGVSNDLLEAWDEGLIDRGARIMHERTAFLKEFEPLLLKTAAEVALGVDEVGIAYEPDGVEVAQPSVNEYRDALWLRSKELRNAEVRRGTTLFGPHRDDFVMHVNGGDVRTSASQGQHKTLLIGLKVAEFHYLSHQCAETPIILLDDIFGDLDVKRAERVYDITRELAQVFVTVVSLDVLPFLRGRTLSRDDAHFTVEGGRITTREYGDRRLLSPVDPVLTVEEPQPSTKEEETPSDTEVSVAVTGPQRNGIEAD